MTGVRSYAQEYGLLCARMNTHARTRCGRVSIHSHICTHATCPPLLPALANEFRCWAPGLPIKVAVPMLSIVSSCSFDDRSLIEVSSGVLSLRKVKILPSELRLALLFDDEDLESLSPSTTSSNTSLVLCLQLVVY